MTNFKYNKITNTTLKASGLLDTDDGTIEIDGEEKSLLNMISDFNGCIVDISVSVRTSEELGAPETNDIVE